MNKTLSVLATAAAFTVAVGAAQARDQISIVGSSTVYPFSTAAAEEFGNSSAFKTPVVESTGSGGGLKLFCAGIGENTPDITNASRRIKQNEFETCKSNNIDVVEFKIGYDGIVIANAKSSPELALTKAQVYKAFAKYYVGPNGKVATLNPYTKWSDIDDSLPDTKIEAFGPPPTSGTRDAFVEIAMDGGAKKNAFLKELRGASGEEEVKAALAKFDGFPADCQASAEKKWKGKDAFKCMARTLREDGAWVDAGENDNAIVGTLEQNPTAVGVFGFSFLDQNSDRIKGATIDGVAPGVETIAAGDYPVSRSLWFYVKKNHIDVTTAQGEMVGFVSTFMDDDQIGPEGALLDKGLIPLPDAERAEWQAKVESLAVMTGNEGLK